MNAQIHFRGPLRYRLRSAAGLMQAMFDPDAPQSAEALRMLGQVIDEKIRARIAMCTPSQ